jgi:DNA-binding PadR family transcriptional regulator
MPINEPRPVGPLSMAVLALLHEEPMHPYQISFTMRERHWDWCIKLKFGSLYHTVETLIRDGLIEPVETEREGRRPERTVYAVTDRGRQEFLERLSDMVRQPAREYADFAAGLKFMWHLDRDAAVSLLRQRADTLQLEVDHVGTVVQMLDSVKRLRRLNYLELEHAQAMSRAEITWIRELADQIASGDLQWKVGHQEAVELKEVRA